MMTLPARQPGAYYQLSERRGQPNGIERANPDTLSGVFSSFDDANWTDKAKLSDERLKDLIEYMSKIKVGNNNYSADVMGDSYEFFIKSSRTSTK